MGEGGGGGGLGDGVASQRRQLARSIDLDPLALSVLGAGKRDAPEGPARHTCP